MSLILYINAFKIDLEKNQTIARTLQVNDLAKLDTRQSNRTNRLKALRTAHNTRTLKNLGLIASNSNIPYVKNDAKLFDESGYSYVPNGRAVVVGTDKKYFDIVVYDGIIEFSKAIENKSITDVGISDLNHLKNVPNVIASFTEDLPYKYIVADYNGKAFYGGNLNIDYLVPSAKVSYIWDRIHQFAGFTFEGLTFQTEKFINHYITYPKPVPVNTPKTTLITSQDSEIIENPVEYPVGMGGVFFGQVYYAKIFPLSFDTDEANNNPGYIHIEESGAYRLKCTGSFTNAFGTDGLVNWSLRDSANALKSEGQINAQLAQSVVIGADINDRIYLNVPRTGQNSPELYNPLTGGVSSTLELIEGYDANFDEVFFEFMVKDFVNDIMVHYGLTPFKAKGRNHIIYRNLKELLQNEEIEDWSEMFVEALNEKYTLGEYAQKNRFKYKYNDENDKHNDGFITINDANLNDEITIVESKIYSPEKYKTPQFLGTTSNIYKIWNKEVKDDGVVEYKELSGRFYYLRYEQMEFDFSIEITSESLNTSESTSVISFHSDYRLKFQQVIYDNYSAIGALLDKLKVRECDFFLPAKLIDSFDFQKLIYVRQLASYFLVNKIANFIKGKKTKVELIEVDYFKTLIVDDIETVLSITNAYIEDCVISIDVTTNIEQPFEVQIIPYHFASGPTGEMVWQPFDTVAAIISSIDSNNVSFLADFLPYSAFGYRFTLKYTSNVFETTTSNLSGVVIVPGSCIVTTPLPNVLTIDNVVFLGTTPSFPFTYRNYKLFYTYDALPPGTPTYTLRIWGYIALFGWTYTDYVKIPGAIGGPTGTDGEQQTTFGYEPTKIKIQIFDKVSAEHIL